LPAWCSSINAELGSKSAKLALETLRCRPVPFRGKELLERTLDAGVLGLGDVPFAQLSESDEDVEATVDTVSCRLRPVTGQLAIGGQRMKLTHS
jgi:hypothetical protein